MCWERARLQRNGPLNAQVVPPHESAEDPNEGRGLSEQSQQACPNWDLGPLLPAATAAQYRKTTRDQGERSKGPRGIDLGRRDNPLGSIVVSVPIMGVVSVATRHGSSCEHKEDEHAGCFSHLKLPSDPPVGW